MTCLIQDKDAIFTLLEAPPIHSLHQEAANSSLFFVLDLYRQACLEEKNVSLGRRWFEKVPALP